VRLLTKSSLRYLLLHRALLMLSVTGVALGVAVVLSIDLATTSARTAFRISAETVSGRATHQIASDAGPVDELLLARARIEAGVRSAPVVEGFASSPLLPGQALRILGIDPFSEGPFRPFVVGGTGGLDVGGFVTTRGGVILSAPTAARAGLGAGDSLPALVGGRSWRLPVVGTLEPTGELTRAGLSDVLLMDIAGAQEMLDLSGGLTRIDLLIPDGEGSAAAIERVRALLAPSETLTPTGTRAATMAGMIDAFDVNLTALSLLALIFGMFLIYNAVTFSVVQRRELLGRLRALGVTRGEILRMILAESAWIAAVGSMLGLALGVVLSRGLVRLVTRTINDLYFVVSVEGIQVDPLLLAKAGSLGLGATLLAAVPAGLEAASSEPRVALLRSAQETSSRRAVPRAAAAGVASVVAGSLLVLLPTRSLVVSFTALFFVVGGLALLTPAGALACVRVVRAPLRRVGGSLGLLAARGLVRSLSRTTPAIAALAVAVSVTVGLGVMIASFRGTLTRWLDSTLRADIYVSLPGPTASRAVGTLPSELIEAFVSHPEVVGHSTYRGTDVFDAVGAFRLVVLALDPRGEETFDFVDGDAAAIMRAFRAGEGALVSEPFAFRRRVAVGEPVEVPTPAGPRDVPALGVFYDYGSDQGAVIVSRALYDRYFDDPGVTSLALFLSGGADSEAVVRDLLTRVPQGLAVIARTNDVLRASSLEVFDRTFRVTVVLRMLAFAVAFVGVLSALMALALERQRELGAMRAWGLEPAELRRLVLTQTGLMGLISGALAIPMGLALSAVMIFVINKRSFGWTLHMEVGPEVLAQALALSLVAALIAGVYPAWRMSRTSPAVALRGE
jgi:putative ABC transport system permease protein